MNGRPLLLPCCLFAALCGEAIAHGGQYRGPGDVRPPSSSSTTSTSPSSSSQGSAASAAGSSSSSTTAASAPSSPNAASSGVAGAMRGAALDADLTRWEFWWEFGKDPYLRLRDVVDGRVPATNDADGILNPRFAHRLRRLEPTTAADADRVAMHLRDLLRQASDRDTASACLVALAKIGSRGAAFDLRAELLPFLQRNDQELRETAALALGISGIHTAENIDLLLALVHDEAPGRTASGQASVNERTRAFAAYALGLLLQRTTQAALSLRIVDGLLAILAAPDLQRADLKVAAIEALALLPATWHAPAAGLLRQRILETLGAYYTRALGPGEQLVQAHVPTAIARLANRDAGLGGAWKVRFAADLAAGLAAASAGPGGGKGTPHIAQSCALALGDLCSPWTDALAADDAHCRLLWRAYREHRDQQVRAFAVLALGRIGGALARSTLVQELPTAGRAMEQPWLAMALGVLSAREIAASNSGAAADPATVAALQAGLEGARNPNTIGAFAIALGLCQHRPSSDTLRALLREHRQRDDLAGYLCIGLGLMADDLAIGEIRAVMQGSERRPQVLLQSARALGLLRDGTVVTDLCRQIQGSSHGLARLAALAAALGQIGDRRSLEPLLTMSADPSLTPLTRAFAVVALGSICDKDPLPWNAAYASTTNYRAATDTLTDGAAGILDIL